MANTQKITKTMRFEEIKAIVKDRADLVEFLNHEIELLAKKSARKSAKVDEAKVGIKNEILEALATLGKGTVTEICKALDNKYSNQKVSALLYQLVDNELVTVEKIKGKSIFEVVASNEEATEEEA